MAQEHFYGRITLNQPTFIIESEHGLKQPPKTRLAACPRSPDDPLGRRNYP